MINLKQVTKIYPGGVVGVKNINLRVKPGEFVSIVGQSGTGKTTLIKLLIAEERPTKGLIDVGGWEISRIKSGQIPWLRRQLGVVFQDFKLLPQKTVFENVAFALEVCGERHSRVKEIVPQALKVVGLDEKADRYPRQISGGEQQRVVIARAIVHRPKILVADEPTGNLDAYNTREVIRILKKVNEFGTTVLLVTHNRDVVNSLKQRVITLDGGQIVSDVEEGRYRI